MVVGAMVVERAEQVPVSQVGLPAPGPGVAAVVHLAPGGGDVAALGATRPLSYAEGLALRG
jgi:hypothetical protein